MTSTALKLFPRRKSESPRSFALEQLCGRLPDRGLRVDDRLLPLLGRQEDLVEVERDDALVERGHGVERELVVASARRRLVAGASPLSKVFVGEIQAGCRHSIDADVAVLERGNEAVTMALHVVGLLVLAAQEIDLHQP